MPKSHEKFHSTDGKRLILVVDDEPINRMILEGYLEEEYEVITAADGGEAIEKIHHYKDLLSLVLLDLLLPDMNGLDILKEIKTNRAMQNIPVIVVTSEQDEEVRSLVLGAIDFIPKPYPKPEVVLARIQKTIELSEDRDIIHHTERDALTGLYNREYFYQYALQFDLFHKEIPMDAVVIDINHFHMINERFGKNYGDSILRKIGERAREIVQDSDGIVCRREADTFLVYCRHREDYQEVLDYASLGLAGDDSGNSRVRLRMGVYYNVDKSLDVERRFDRAKQASDTVRNSFQQSIGYYDDTLHEKELFAEQLVEEFHTAIQEQQFCVHYQPKFDVRPEIPILASAEALVRWQHPTLGMISPGLFIPLFEENGLIKELDQYVWRKAAAQIRDWKDRFNFSVPVSVNVSRIDMYDPELIPTFVGILNEFQISARELLLEITESAYTKDSEQIIETVNRLRALGFKVEMDDFGTGYSSLNMISTLPIDALKLDMQFIRNAFKEGRDTRMLEVIIDIADYLSVPVIAEGVETQEQLHALRAMGCDMVQGYYFSKPLPAEEYERYVVERKDQETSLPPRTVRVQDPDGGDEASFGKIAQALSSGFECIYYVDIETNHYVEFNSEGKFEDLQIERSGDDFFEDAVLSITSLVYEEDRERLTLCLKKDALLDQLMDAQPFSITYRMVLDREPVYYNLKAVKSRRMDDQHIVIGINNVDEQMKQAGQTLIEPANSLNFNMLAYALTSDMECIYYVDMVSDTYKTFTANGDYTRLPLHLTGMNFFREFRENMEKLICEEDKDKVLDALEKENLKRCLKDRSVFSLIFRLLIENRILYYQMKVVSAGGKGDPHVIIGISNVDAQVAQEEELKARKTKETVTYASIAQALAADYFSIYYVDPETDQYFEYSSHLGYHGLDPEKSGENFFDMDKTNALKSVYPEDFPMVRSAINKKKLLKTLEKNGTFTLTYRLLFDGVPTYVHLKASLLKDGAGKHIVIGISNVDDQIRREQEHAKAMRMANRDALTGVKSKYAYLEEESRINQSIASGNADPFAIAVCDLNDLKTVNDTLGHKAGDQYICDACATICDVFKHSPVFRVGGDEFVAILRGVDYEHRESLQKLMTRANEDKQKQGGAIIACGMSDYIPGQDADFDSVFNRADAAMYEDKKSLKKE